MVGKLLNLYKSVCHTKWLVLFYSKIKPWSQIITVFHKLCKEEEWLEEIKEIDFFLFFNNNFFYLFSISNVSKSIYQNLLFILS